MTFLSGMVNVCGDSRGLQATYVFPPEFLEYLQRAICTGEPIPVSGSDNFVWHCRSIEAHPDKIVAELAGQPIGGLHREPLPTCHAQPAH
jgi:hypothetical protein